MASHQVFERRQVCIRPFGTACHENRVHTRPDLELPLQTRQRNEHRSHVSLLRLERELAHGC